MRVDKFRAIIIIFLATSSLSAMKSWDKEVFLAPSSLIMKSLKDKQEKPLYALCIKGLIMSQEHCTHLGPIPLRIETIPESTFLDNREPNGLTMRYCSAMRFIKAQQKIFSSSEGTSPQKIVLACVYQMQSKENMYFALPLDALINLKEDDRCTLPFPKLEHEDIETNLCVVCKQHGSPYKHLGTFEQAVQTCITHQD